MTKNKAIIVIDMLNDFVTGVFGSEKVQKIVPNIAGLLKKARIKNIEIIYLCTCLEKEDYLVKLWGTHAIKGTPGTNIIRELKPENKDIIIYKKLYSGFLSPTLDTTLKNFGVDTLIFTGVYTDICIQNNVTYAFHLGYNTIVVSDCTASTGNNQNYSLNYMKNIYRTEIVKADELEL